jgi:hypothetical protein
MKELSYSSEVDLRTIERPQVPKSLRGLLADVESGDRIVTGFINGEGISFEFVFLIGPRDGGDPVVKLLLMDTDVEGG